MPLPYVCRPPHSPDPLRRLPYDDHHCHRPRNNYQQAFQRAPPSMKRFSFVASYVAVAAAGSMNVLFTRASEITGGVQVTDESGEVRKGARRSPLLLIESLCTPNSRLGKDYCFFFPKFERPAVGTNRVGHGNI